MRSSEESGRRARDAYARLRRAAGATASRLQRSVLAEAGLTESQFRVLETVCDRGPMAQGELAREILKSSGNLTLVVDNLEKRSLVHRRRCAEDRRCVEVHLTAEGQRLIEQLWPRHLEAVVEEMSALSTAEQRELERLCRKLEPDGP